MHQLDHKNSAIDSMTNALIEANDQLLALYALTEVTSDSLDGTSSVQEILSRAQTLLDADALVFETDTGETIATVGRPTGINPPAPTGAVLTNSAGARASTTADITVSNASGLAARLLAYRRHRPFGTPDQKLATAVANLALGAWHTSQMHRDALSQAIMARDHDTASELAVRALPQWQPQINGAELYARSDPARAAGGDLFTYSVVDDVLHFVVGDVSGKGLPAAMMMTNVISASLAAFQSDGHRGPAAVLSRIDAWMYDYLSQAGLFVTLVVGSYDPQEKTVLLSNAGHSPVLWIDGAKAAVVEAATPPVGVLPLTDATAPTEVVLSGGPGNRLVVSSDGFTEQLDRRGNMFGEERLVNEIINSSDPGSTLGPQLYTALVTHADGAEQSDDRTLVILDIHGPDSHSPDIHGPDGRREGRTGND